MGTKKNVEPMSQVIDMSRSSSPLCHHCVATTPTVKANVFPEKNLHKFLIDTKKEHHFLLAKLPNIKPLPLSISGFSFCPACCNHRWNISSKFNGGAIPKTICAPRHRNLA
jgi:hypothetical protein